MTARPHDALFKETFSDLANARGELRSVLPPAVAAMVDWDTLRLEPGSFVDEALRETMTDLLFSVRIQGRDARLYVLFEHQSSPDPLMPFRALAYVVRIWDAWLRGQPRARMLPPVIPMVLSQVEGGWTAPTDLLSVIEFADDAERETLRDLVPQCRVLIDDLAHVSNEALDRRAMPDAARLALAALRDVRAADDVVGLVTAWTRWIRALLAQPGGHAALKALFSYIWNVRGGIDLEAMAASTAAIDPRAKETLMTTAEELMQRGEAKGRFEGKAEGKAEVLLKLLQLRFTTVPPEAAQRVRAADAATIDRWVERVLTATSIEDVCVG